MTTETCGMSKDHNAIQARLEAGTPGPWQLDGPALTAAMPFMEDDSA